MKNYWPRCSAPKGFSIAELAKSYRAKISGISIEDKTIQNELIAVDANKTKAKTKSNFLGHWANRDFNEYLDAA